MKKILTLVFLSAFLISSQISLAQFSIGVQGVSYNGVDKFGEHINNAGGASFVGMFSFPNSRFSLGMNLGSSCYYMTEEKRTLEAEGYSNVTAEVSEEDGFYNVSLFTRFNLLKPGLLNPYFEGRIGLNTFYHSMEYMEMTTTDVDGQIPEDLHCVMDISGTAFYSGLGAGINLDISKFFKSWVHVPIFFDASFNYNFGGRTHFYGNGSSEIDPQAKTQPTLQEGKTDHYTSRFGLMVMFK